MSGSMFKTLAAAKQAKSLFKLIDLLEDNDDVQEVTSNFEVSEEILMRLSA